MREIAEESERPTTRGGGAERLLVIGVFAVMSAALYFYVWYFGRNVPFWDDWDFVPAMTGHEPLSLPWLWTPHNEHSIPVVRLAIVLAWRIAGDLRAMMFVSATLLCIGVWGLVATTWRSRGRPAFTDAVYPLALLNWGLFENLIFATQFFYVAVAMLGLAIVILGMGRTTIGPGRATVIAACLVGLPLFGAIGLAMLPCLLVWAAATGFQSIRSEDSRRRYCGAFLLTGCAIAVVAALGSIAVLPVGATMTNRGTLFEMVRTSCEMLSTSIGPAGQMFWRYSTIGTIAAVATTAGLAVRAVRQDSDEFPSSSLLCAGIGAYLAVVAAVGFGRGAFGPGQGFSNRYALFTSAMLCLCYLGFSLYARGLAGRAARAGLLMVLTAALVTNVVAGVDYGADRAERADAFVDAIESGVPADAVAARFADRIYPAPELLAARLEMLRDARWGPYSNPGALPDMPPCREVDVSLTRLGTHHLEPDGELYRATGDDPFVLFALPEPVFLCGVRLRFTVTNASDAAPEIQLYWADSSNSGIAEGRRHTVVPIQRTSEVQERIVWIYGTVDQLRIDPPGSTCVIGLEQISLFVRETPR